MWYSASETQTHRRKLYRIFELPADAFARLSSSKSERYTTGDPQWIPHLVGSYSTFIAMDIDLQLLETVSLLLSDGRCLG